jgi:hypothetical protein
MFNGNNVSHYLKNVVFRDVGHDVTEDSEERIASISKMERIRELGKTLAASRHRRENLKSYTALTGWDL